MFRERCRLAFSMSTMELGTAPSCTDDGRTWLQRLLKKQELHTSGNVFVSMTDTDYETPCVKKVPREVEHLSALKR